jgi:hypothetical protein
MEILARPEILPIRHAVSASLSHGWLSGLPRETPSGKTYIMKLSIRKSLLAPCRRAVGFTAVITMLI